MDFIEVAKQQRKESFILNQNQKKLLQHIIERKKSFIGLEKSMEMNSSHDHIPRKLKPPQQKEDEVEKRINKLRQAIELEQKIKAEEQKKLQKN